MSLDETTRNKKNPKKRQKKQDNFDNRIRIDDESASPLYEMQRAIGNQMLSQYIKANLAKRGNKAVTYSIDQNYTSKLFQREQAHSLNKVKPKKDDNQKSKQDDRVATAILKMPVRQEKDDEIGGDQLKAKLPGLPDILFDDYFGKVFQSFVKRDGGFQNIDCYKLINQYKQTPSRSLAITIHDLYIKSGLVKISGATKRNLSYQIDELRNQKSRKSKQSRMRQSVLSLFNKMSNQKNDHHANLFELAAREVQSNLNNSYNRFILSPECSQAIEQANLLMSTIQKGGDRR